MHSAPMIRLTPKIGLLALLFVTACGPNGTDWDLRSDRAFNTRTPAQLGDANGLINYSGYQAVTATNGENVRVIADRLGINAEELARFNAIGLDDPLRSGEILVLPNQIATSTTPTGLDVTALASSALDRVETSSLAPIPQQVLPPVASVATTEPARHKVQRGETAFGIARQYNVSAKTLADWNGLGPDLNVREGQFLLIPTAGATPPQKAVSVPGEGTPTPVPPSAKEPLPAATAKAEPAPAAPDLSTNVTAASAATFAMPVSGKIIRPYAKGKNDGIDIAANAGSAVKAAGDGTVAAVTKDTKGTPIVVIRHKDGLLTVYAGVDGLTVAKGDTVKRGQNIAVVRAGDPAFLHFEVRKGVESADPMAYLQ